MSLIRDMLIRIAINNLVSAFHIPLLQNLVSNIIFVHAGSDTAWEVVLSPRKGDFSGRSCYLNVKEALQVIQYVSHKSAKCSYSIRI